MVVKIKRNIIISTLSSVLIVLFGVVGILNVSTYNNIAREADTVLMILANNDGKFPNKEDYDNVKALYNVNELPYETRYFSVKIGYLDKIINYDLSNIAAVDKDMVTAMVSVALSKNLDAGYVGNYRFLKSYVGDRIKMIVFIDCGKSLSMFRASLWSSILYSAIGFVLVVLLSWFLSRQAMSIYEITEEKQQKFISNAGHEIKTPIAVINADVQVLEMDYGNNEWCDDIRIQTERLTKLTHDLITLTRMESLVYTPEKELISLSNMAEETAHSFTAIAKTKEKNFNYFIDKDIMIKGSQKDIKELLDILLDNAMKYSRPNGSILLNVKKEKVPTVVVSNSLPAEFDASITEHMFDRFYRGDESHNADNNGYGIGLAVAKATTKKYQGNIRAEVKENTMTITATLRGLK